MYRAFLCGCFVGDAGSGTVSFTMKAMPFINQLQHWAAARPHRPAVVVGTESLDFAALRDGAAGMGHGDRTLTIIDRHASTALAVEFCAAVAGGGVAAVLESTWPAALRASIAAQASSWAMTLPTPVPSDMGFFDGPPDSTFLLGLSSGTSGLPKAFTRSRESWRASFVHSVDYFGLAEGCITLAPGPMAASMNLYALGEAIHSGTTFVALPSFSPDAALAAIMHHAVTRLVLVPSVLGLLARRGLESGRGPGSLTSIVCAGSALPDTILEQARRWAPNARIDFYYGASELGFVAATRGTEPADAAPRTDSTTVESWGAPAAGRAFPGAELAVLGPTGALLGLEEIGSVYVRSPYVSNGYAWGDDGLSFSAATSGNQDAVQRSGQWFTVHDQGYLRGDGVLHLVGRAQDMVITSGSNVYPQQVEQALEGHPADGTVVVTGIADPIRGQRLVAGLVAGTLPMDDFLRACRERAARLPAHQRPTLYFALSRSPLSAGGKPSRTLLREWITAKGAHAQRIY